MKTKTYEEIVECVQIIERCGGESALKERLEVVDAKIDDLKARAVRLENRIMEFEMERCVINTRLIGERCAHCQDVINEAQYTTPLMEGKVFCSNSCLLSEVIETIKEQEV